MSFEKPWGNYLLEKIVETPAPETVSLWPETIAWQFLFIALFVFVVNKAYRIWKTYQVNIYRRQAIAWLKQCSLSNEEDIRQLPTLLRKTALLANKVTKQSEHKKARDTAIERHHDISQLSGESWAKWLDSHCDKSSFSNKNGNYHPAKLLTELAYAPTLNLGDSKFTEALTMLCQQIDYWIIHHDLSCQRLDEINKIAIKGEQHD